MDLQVTDDEIALLRWWYCTNYTTDFFSTPTGTDREYGALCSLSEKLGLELSDWDSKKLAEFRLPEEQRRKLQAQRDEEQAEMFRIQRERRAAEEADFRRLKDRAKEEPSSGSELVDLMRAAVKLSEE